MPDLTPEILADLRGKAETAKEVFLDRDWIAVDAPLMLALIEAAQCAVQLEALLVTRCTSDEAMIRLWHGAGRYGISFLGVGLTEDKFPAAVAGLVKELNPKETRDERD